MGLSFSNACKNLDAKKTCLLCGGEGVPLVEPVVVCGKPLCRRCATKVSMEPDRLPNLSREELDAHLEYRQQNMAKLQSFADTYECPLFGEDFELASLLIDEQAGTFMFSGVPNPPIFALDQIQEVTYLEDERVIRRVWKGGSEEGSSVMNDLVEYDKDYDAIDYTLNFFLRLDIGKKWRKKLPHVLTLKVALKDDPYWNVYTVQTEAPTYHNQQAERYVNDYNRATRGFIEAINTLESYVNQ
ncbi:MAG: hypothetical protein PUA57_02795 [Eggerthellales bacterium]|nr:hypothetical protein [Eggerthellales bacterium]